jgi:O-antigen ligase
MRGGALSAGAIVGLAAADGGFFASSWRVGTVVLGALACLLALWTPLRRTSATAALIAPIAALAALSAASALWSVDAAASLLDVQRTLLYVVALASFVLAGEGLVGGVCLGVGVVGGWALVERAIAGTTFDRYEGRLLTGPIGYANGLGALMAVGAVLCLVSALQRRRAALIAPLAIFIPALVMTESRASVAALLAGIIVGVLVVQGRRATAGLAALGAAALLGYVLLFTPAGFGDRAAYWSAARATIAEHPLSGTGAGTYGLVHQQAPHVRDAHSLFLQAFSELGVAGLLLAIAIFTIPIALSIRHELAGPAAGLVVLALHTGVDWDWQLPAVTLAALALAASSFEHRDRLARHASARGARRG